MVNKVLNKEVKVPDQDEQLKEDLIDFYTKNSWVNNFENVDCNCPGGIAEIYMIPIRYANQPITEDAEFEVIETKLLPGSKE